MVCKSQGIVNKKVSKICLMWESRTDVSLQYQQPLKEKTNRLSERVRGTDLSFLEIRHVS